jgi:hypothetical protein
MWLNRAVKTEIFQNLITRIKNSTGIEQYTSHGTEFLI